MKVNNFKELTVWQKAMDLAVDAYVLTGYFPKEEKFGLISQIQRAAVSIPSNIAEGCGRISPKEFQHFLAIAMGSAFEIETEVILASRLGYITENQLNEFEGNVAPVQRMLNGLYDSIERKK